MTPPAGAPPPSPRVGRAVRLVLAALVLALASIGVVTAHLVARERAALLDRFSEEARQQLVEASRGIQEELADLTEDLVFAAHLVHRADSSADRQRELATLLTVVRHYRRVAVYGADGRATLFVTDAGAEAAVKAGELDGTMAEAARQALGRPTGRIDDRRADAAAGSPWYRAVATATPDGRGAVVILVDSRPYFERLRLLASQPASRAALLGPRGLPLPAKDLHPPGAAPPDDRLGGLAGAAAAGPVRSRIVGEEEAVSLGLERAEAVAVQAAIPVAGGNPWSATLVRSTSMLRRHERALTLRLGLAAAAFALCLAVAAGYVVISTRRHAVMRERLRHAHEVGRLHERAQKILDHMPAGVLAVSAAGIVTAANHTLRQHLGELSGRTLGGAFPAAPAGVQERVVRLAADAAATGEVQRLLLERAALFGEPGHYSLHAVPLDPAPEDARVVLVVEDLSALRTLESRLLQAEKLATVGMLSAGIAHEIGTPLGVVRGRAELLLDRLGSTHAQAPSARAIIEQIDLVTRTIRQLLDFSRASAVHVQPTSLIVVASRITELLSIEATRRKIRLELAIPPGLAPLAADPDQLQQVLVNVIVNAFDACGEGNRVTVSAREGRPGDSVEIEVKDDGGGIPEGNLSRVFDPFFTTKKRGQGTGLGLTIAAQLVRNHGGQIDLDSTAGRGTTVRIEWPQGKATEARHDLAS